MAMDKKQERRMDRKIGRAILEHKMIEEGDRVLVAVSGGKDSLTMLHFLNKKKKGLPFDFDLEAIHVKTEFTKEKEFQQMLSLLESWGIPITIIQVNVEERLKEGRKMNCYWCSTQRRTELMRYAEKHNFNKIALGHHMDDIIETFFMNMSYKGELSTMLPYMKYDNYPQTMIRPLCRIKEKEIIAFTEDLGISKVVCTCNFDTTSKRRDMRRVLDFMEKTEGAWVKDNIYKALHNVQTRYLIQTREEDTP